jgi:gluconolactonase
MFAAPPVIQAELFASVPARLRRPGFQSEWTEIMRHGVATDCFIEGPSFDRDGNLLVCDIPSGRIFRVVPDGEFSVVAEYDGEPCGLKFRKDGHALITDFVHGVMELDPANGKVKPYLDRYLLQRFRGVNDLVFADNGDLYFTDQGQSGMHDPTGRLFRCRANGQLDLILGNVPSPNGVVLSADQNAVYLAVTRSNCVWRVPLLKGGQIAKVGVFLQLSGSLAGPDGLAVDEAGNIVVAQAGSGAVWLFSRIGEPLFRIQSSTGLVQTNVAYGWPDRHWLYITESDTGNILRARLPVPGRIMFSHQP